MRKILKKKIIIIKKTQRLCSNDQRYIFDFQSSLFLALQITANDATNRQVGKYEKREANNCFVIIKPQR